MRGAQRGLPLPTPSWTRWADGRRRRDGSSQPSSSIAHRVPRSSMSPTVSAPPSGSSRGLARIRLASWNGALPYKCPPRNYMAHHCFQISRVPPPPPLLLSDELPIYLSLLLPIGLHGKVDTTSSLVFWPLCRWRLGAHTHHALLAPEFAGA